MPHHRLIYRFIPFVILLALSSCKNDSSTIAPRQASPRINLDTLLVESTEIDLHISTTNTTSLGNISIFRDSVEVFSKHIKGKDTVIVDTSVLPSHTYLYYAYELSSDLHTRIDSSRKIPFRTMDTTSHNFTWELDTLGDGMSSILNDVIIINDTCVWAVGEIHIRDSSGKYLSMTFNAASWNGSRWKLQSVPTAMYPNYIDTFELYSVFAFNPNDIWTYCAAGSYSHWDGSSWSTAYFPNNPGTPSKFWGTSSANLYLVGYGGTISHFNGSSWQKQESGTTVNLTDVWGSPDGSVVWACGYYLSQFGTYLLKNANGTGWQIVYDGTQHEYTILSDSLCGDYTSVFAPSKNRLFVASDAGLYSMSALTHGEAKRISFIPTYFPGLPYRLRGNGVNDITMVGNYNFIAHYNGQSMMYYSHLYNSDWELYSVDQKGNLVVAVGEMYDPINSRGLVVRGKR